MAATVEKNEQLRPEQRADAGVVRRQSEATAGYLSDPNKVYFIDLDNRSAPAGPRGPDFIAAVARSGLTLARWLRCRVVSDALILDEFGCVPADSRAAAPSSAPSSSCVGRLDAAPWRNKKANPPAS